MWMPAQILLVNLLRWAPGIHRFHLYESEKEGTQNYPREHGLFMYVYVYVYVCDPFGVCVHVHVYVDSTPRFYCNMDVSQVQKRYSGIYKKSYKKIHEVIVKSIICP